MDWIEQEPFRSSGTAHPARHGDPDVLRFVSCGHAFPGHEVRIVDERGDPVGERVEGRIEFRGPSVTAGYFRNPGATCAALRGSWMDSGDLGYLVRGELFVTGRRKDPIIRGGRNIYP